VLLRRMKQNKSPAEQLTDITQSSNQRVGWFSEKLGYARNYLLSFTYLQRKAELLRCTTSSYYSLFNSQPSRVLSFFTYLRPIGYCIHLHIFQWLFLCSAMTQFVQTVQDYQDNRGEEGGLRAAESILLELCDIVSFAVCGN